VAPHSANRSLVVGLSTNVIDPSLRGGRLDGIGVYTQALLDSLRSSGVEVRRVGAPAVFGGRLRSPTADIRLPLPAVPSIAWSALTGAASPLWHNVERAIDVYHATDNRVPRLRRVPVVATIYDAIPLMRPEWASPRLRGLKNWLLHANARNADCIIAISEAAVDEIVAHYDVPRERIRVVQLGVSDDWFGEPTGFDLAADVQPGYFLFVGTLQPRKNVQTLLRAYDRLDAHIRADHQLVIAGGYGWGVEDLRRELERRRGDKRVLWLEYVDHRVLRRLYREAAAFVFPSLAEGFGLPVLEAFASGLPVVASDIPAVREIAGKCAILASPEDAEALAAAMTQALAVERSASADGKRRSWARRFDWKTCAARTLAVYRQLV
jgi:alpha-1,3-rhamnosyl/mannosyltransferase